MHMHAACPRMQVPTTADTLPLLTTAKRYYYYYYYYYY